MSVLSEGRSWTQPGCVAQPGWKFSDVYDKTHIPPGEPYTATVGGTFPVFETPLGRTGNPDLRRRQLHRHCPKTDPNGAQLIVAPLSEFRGFGEQYWTEPDLPCCRKPTAVVVTGASQSGSAIIDPYGGRCALDLNKDG